VSEQTITHAYMYGNMHFLEASVGFRHVMKALYFEYSLRLAHDASLRMYENTHIHRSLLLLLLLILADDSVERQVHYFCDDVCDDAPEVLGSRHYIKFSKEFSNCFS